MQGQHAIKHMNRLEEEVEELNRKLSKQAKQLEEADKVIDIMVNKGASTTVQSICWLSAVEYQDKYKGKE